MVCCDTSFLFSLYGSDSHTGRSLEWVRNSKEAIHLSPLNEFEFANSIRLAQFRKLVTGDAVQSRLRGFNEDLSDGFVVLSQCDLFEVLRLASELSSTHTAQHGFRSFDLLHVAFAKWLNAHLFLTFDDLQKQICLAAGVPAGP